MKRIITCLVLVAIFMSTSILAFETQAAIDYSTYYTTISIKNTGTDIYSNPDAYGYQYGPSIIVNEDGSLDCWLAAQGSSAANILDFISYTHSDDGGKTWSERKLVLEPTPLSKDRLSCCDPGVICFGGYYYIGYTSTLDKSGYANSVFVARSENPDGPFEKWNGNGWGGDPEPLVLFEGDGDQWGIGEPSFVEKDGTLYVYYSYKDECGYNTMVATCDATNENWPATLEKKGIAIPLNLSDGYSATDVKYVDRSGKFVAMNIAGSFTEEPRLVIYESNDGLHFIRSTAVTKNFGQYAHNNGMSGSKNGHIVNGQKTYIAYAYGQSWGHWSTRISEYSLNYSQYIKDDEPSYLLELLEPGQAETSSYITGITAYPHYYIKNVSSEPFDITVWAYSNTMKRTTLTEGITFTDYDDSVVSFDGITCTPVGIGETSVVVHYGQYICNIKIVIRPDGVSTTSSAVYSYKPYNDHIYMALDETHSTAIRGIALTYAGQIGDAFGDQLKKAIFNRSNYPVCYYGYNYNIIDINEQGIITAKKQGTTTVTVDINGSLFFTVLVTIGPAQNAIEPEPTPTPDQPIEQEKAETSAISNINTVGNLDNAKDFRYAKGEYTTMRDISTANDCVIVNARQIKGENEYSLCLDSGTYTVLISYNDGTRAISQIIVD